MSNSILLIGHEGRLRDGLRAILRAHPRINEVHTATNLASARESITALYPSLIILDGSDTVGDECKFMKLFFSLQGHIPCIVIANTLEQQTNAQTAGADAVLVQGFSTDELYAALEQLLTLTDIGRGSALEKKEPFATDDRPTQTPSPF